MKKLNIPSALTGLVFGLIVGVFVYLFVPPPSTASADSCEGASVYAWNCAESCSTDCATDCATTSDVRRHCATDCATRSDVEELVYHYCS